MTHPVSRNSSPIQSYYHPSEQESLVDDPNGGTGGVAGAPTSGNAAARGAGNADRTPRADALSCIPEAVLAAKECGVAYLLRTAGRAAVCAATVAQLAACVTSDE